MKTELFVTIEQLSNHLSGNNHEIPQETYPGSRLALEPTTHKVRSRRAMHATASFGLYRY
jgi:hypothetical protein